MTELGIAFEVEQAPSLAFRPSDPDERKPDDGEPVGGPLPEVAARLGLSLSEAVAALVAHGMPFHDDAVDTGVEVSLRSLFGLGGHAPPLSLESAPAPSSPVPALDRSSPAMIASRVLSRLLRDGRVGGRHTGIEHAYGHHFADEEKKVARRVVDRLLVMGILRKKLNEGAFHVYIDPRRLRDVWAIITMEERDERVFG